MKNYELGNSYVEKYLTNQLGASVKVTDVDPKPYGYKVKMFSNYVCLWDVKLEILEDGRAKATVKVDKNYHAPYQYTIYFNREGREIKASSTRMEREIWES